MTRPPPSLFRRQPSQGSPYRVIGVVLAAGALLLGGCSQVPDYANPVEWYKSAAGVFSGDSTDEAKMEKPPPAPGADQPFPSLGDVPERPSREAKLADLEKVAEGLAADRKNARYTSAPQPEPTAVAAEPAPPAPSNPEPKAAPSPPPEPAPEPASSTRVETPSPSRAAAPAQAGVAQTPVQVASRAPETTGPVDVQALFNRLFAESGPRAVAPPSSGKLPPPPASPPAASAPALSPAPAQPSTAALGASSADKLARAELGAVRDLNEFRGTGSANTVRAAVIHFAVGSAALTAEAKRALRKVARLHKERGGTVRVVGHASSRTREMPLAKHKLVNFEISLKRARAVAQELIRLGVEPEALFVGAVGDNDPVYYEWMPSGEAGNRRAEVYLDF